MQASGTCHVLMAYDVGFEIDLVRAAARLAASRQETFKHKRGTPLLAAEWGCSSSSAARS